jgi:hypothetical protein
VLTPTRLQPSPSLPIVDGALPGSVVVAPALGWNNTRERLRRPWQQCHEGELPTGLVKN